MSFIRIGLVSTILRDVTYGLAWNGIRSSFSPEKEKEKEKLIDKQNNKNKFDKHEKQTISSNQSQKGSQIKKSFVEFTAAMCATLVSSPLNYVRNHQ